MLITVDDESSVALHEQIAGQIRSAIATGTVATGERLPSAKDLAESLAINFHTVLRAYQQLEDEGLVVVRRGRGTTVTDKAPKLANISELAAELVAAARRAGMSDRDVVRLIEVNL